jgi:hypothetical protein
MNSFKFSLQTDAGILGARYGAALTLPVVLAGRAEGFVELDQAKRQNRRSGIGDLYISPIQLNWGWGEHHLTFSQGIFAPTGSYDADRVFNPLPTFCDWHSRLLVQASRQRRSSPT